MPLGAKVVTAIGIRVLTGKGSMVGKLWLVGDALGIGTLGAVLLLFLPRGAAVVVEKAVGSKVGPIVSGKLMGALDAMVGIMDGNDEMRRIVGAIVTGPLDGSSTWRRVLLLVVGTRVGLVVANGTVVGRVVVTSGSGGDTTGGGSGSLDSTEDGSVETALVILDGPADGAGLGLSVVVVGYTVGAWVGTTFPLPMPFPITPFFRDDLDIFPRHADMDPMP
jgi:hypothetical protein